MFDFPTVFGISIACIAVGVMTGAMIMGVLSAKAYDKGVSDASKENDNV